MNAKPFVTLILIITLSLVCLLDCYALLYLADEFDFTTLDTKRTLDARHIIIGEVIYVSSVFQRESYLPSSLVTVGVDRISRSRLSILPIKEQTLQNSRQQEKGKHPLNEP